jgi:predicted MFS family arabinose efflux permease
LKEGIHVPPKKRQHLKDFIFLLDDLYKNKVNRLIFLNLIFWSLSTFYAVWLLQKFLPRKKIILIAGILPIIAYLGMGYLDGYIAVAFGALLYISRGMIQVHLREMYNDILPSNLRATGNSLQSFFFRAGFAATTPLLGLLTDEGGPQFAFLYLGVVFILVYVIFLIRLPKLNS